MATEIPQGPLIEAPFTPILTTTDWNEEWKELQTSRKAADDSSFWDEKSKTFHKPSGNSDYSDHFIEMTGVREGETVFDMGCGTGAIAIPLALKGHHVCAADFSAGMLGVLEKEAAKFDVRNIDVKVVSWAENWQDRGIMPKSYDVAVASRSIVTSDLEDSLRKLSAVARRKCAITLPTGLSPRADETILSAIGIQPRMGRDYLYAFMILISMGYFPEIGYIPSKRYDTFENPQEAFATLSRMVEDACRGVASEDEREEALANLRMWLKDNLVNNPDAGKLNKFGEIEGPLKLKDPRKISWAHISWNV